MNHVITIYDYIYAFYCKRYSNRILFISLKLTAMKEHLILNGLTVEKLSDLIREAVHEEMQQMQLVA